MNKRDDIINKLRSSGVTPTTQRVEIAQILFAQPQHLSAEQILKMVNEDSNSTASKATIYNTLGLFAKKGLVKEVIVEQMKAEEEMDSKLKQEELRERTVERRGLEREDHVEEVGERQRGLDEEIKEVRKDQWLSEADKKEAQERIDQQWMLCGAILADLKKMMVPDSEG